MVTLNLKLDIDFNKKPTLKIENAVLKGIHSTLRIFKRAKWICDYDLKGGEIE